MTDRARASTREWLAVVGLMLVAAAFRLLALDDVPPGLHHDEVIIGQIAKDILRGQLAIYFTPGYGHEPLYHYLLAGMFAAVGASAFVLRLTSAFIALLGLAAAYRLTRRLFSPPVALGTLAWMAVSLWPIFFARVGLRGIALPLLTALTAYFLWRALRLPADAQPPTAGIPAGNSSERLPASRFLLPGALLGLSLYTYQASRTFPIIFLIFALYLALFHREAARRAGRGLIAFFAAAAIVAAPLIVYLTVIHPDAEERIAELSEPLNRLIAGDPSAVVRSTLDTLGMFTVAGDAVPIYNVGGRPVFPEPIGAALFYAGLVVCIWRWRRPAYALLLIWLAISLVPATVTPFSPNFVRTIAAWPIPFIFVGLAMVESGRFALRHSSFAVRHAWLVPACFALLITFNAAATARDYFLDWPRGDYVRFWQQATWTQAARALNADPSSAPVAASGLSIHDFDPQTFDLLGVRSDIDVKWYDCREAMLFPSGAAARYLSPDFFPCDPDVWSRYLPAAEVIAQPRWPDSGNVIFTLHRARPHEGWPPSAAIYVGAESFDASDPSQGLSPISPPLDFQGLRFIGGRADRLTARPGESLSVDTFWAVTAPIAPPLQLFVHVTGPDGTVIAQSDGLGVAIDQLRSGDAFVQRHRLAIPSDAQPRPYRVSIGAYHPDTGSRLTATVDGRQVDSVVLPVLEVME